MHVSRFSVPRRLGDWLSAPRAAAIGQAAALAQATLLVLLALFQHGLLPGTAESPTASDFVSFYAAGKLALAGTPALAYDQAAHYAMEQHFAPAGAPYQFFFYPPVFLLLFAPIAALPYGVAFFGFEAATFAAFLWVARRIVGTADRTWIGAVLAFPAIFWTIGLGQNAFLTAALFGGFTLALRERPGVAGGLLGLVCYKPHFGLLVPIALLCGGHWRAFFAAGATVVGLVGLSAGLFGVETWRAYLLAFAEADSVYATGRIDYAGMISVFGAARLMGFAPSVAYPVQICASLIAAGLVVWGWRRTEAFPARVALLLAATMLAVPMAILYDKMLLLVAMAWLARQARTDGFSGREKILLISVYLTSLLDYAAGAAWAVPLGPAASLAVLAVAVHRLSPRPLTIRVGAVAAA